MSCWFSLVEGAVEEAVEGAVVVSDRVAVRKQASNWRCSDQASAQSAHCTR
jgi:hypothetical protein